MVVTDRGNIRMVMLVMLVRCNAQRYNAGIIIITEIYLRRELQSQPH